MIFIALTLSLLLETRIPMYMVIALLTFEAVTNWRIPTIVTRLRYGENYKQYLNTSPPNNRMMSKLEAERILRVAVIAFIYLPYLVTFQYIDFLPWFVATALVLAGATNICPMVMFLKFTGMR